MYGLLCKRLLLLHLNRSRALLHPTIQLGFLQFDDTSSIHIIRSFSSSLNKSSSAAEEDKQSFAVSYLINSCGLSLETAISVSEKVNLQTPDKADSVLSLLRNHGFSKTHISLLVKKCPTLLFANPEKTLLPKLDFFYSVGISSADLPMILSKGPFLLARSLEKHLIPAYNFLRSVVLNDQMVAAFKRCPSLFSYGAHKKIAPKVDFLRELGVPQSLISRFVICTSPAAMQNNEKFIESVDKAIEMGFNPSKSTFILAIQVISQLSESAWEHKMEIYRRCGWSEDDIWKAFKLHPSFMKLSEKKIVCVMDYIANEMGWQPTAIARNPTVLSYSLEKRIIPRCSVIKTLVLKGLKKDWSSGSFLNASEKRFLDKFVTKYLEEVPLLLNVYRGKTDLLELGFGLAKIQGMKQI